MKKLLPILLLPFLASCPFPDEPDSPADLEVPQPGDIPGTSMNYCDETPNPLTYIPNCENPNWNCIANAEAAYMVDAQAAYDVGCQLQQAAYDNFMDIGQINFEDYQLCKAAGEENCWSDFEAEHNANVDKLMKAYGRTESVVNARLEAANEVFWQSIGQCCPAGMPTEDIAGL